MSKRKIKVYYYYPVIDSGKEVKIVRLTSLLNHLNNKSCDERILKYGEENIQLKKIDYVEEDKRWHLSFLRNRVDAPFKTKLDDDVEIAQQLEEDEYFGQECCAIYDEDSNILSLQNNKFSVSFRGITDFFNKYMDDKIYLSPITYKEKYNEISEDNMVGYKSIVIGYTNIDKIVNLSEEKDNEFLKTLINISNDISSITGKIELGVGRNKSFLEKKNLRNIVNIFKRNPQITKSLKVKMADGDTIRLIDLLSNKVSDEFEINITKNSPKTFKKILNSMDLAFDDTKNEIFDKGHKFLNS